MTENAHGAVLPELSRAEYDILRVLWKNGRQSVREVHDVLNPILGWAYTTTKTMMDRMAAKGLVAREEFHGINLYRAMISRPAGLARFIRFFAERVLETDAASVVALFAQSNAITPDEMRELQQIVGELEER